MGTIIPTLGKHKDVAQGDDFLEYSALRAGHRVDFVRSPVYTFADGRGTVTDFGGGLEAKDAVIILHRRGGERPFDKAQGRPEPVEGRHEISTPMGP